MELFRKLFYYFHKPARFEYLDKWLKIDSIKILDVGCGNQSPQLTKTYYPNCIYWGIDKSRHYNLSERDYIFMDKFYALDLSDVKNLNIIPSEFFDCLILSHVIEHLRNGEDVILELLQKLKRGGKIYIEFPSPHSIYLPSMRETLNFYDDPTHVKLYNLKELRELLITNSCVIIKCGIRHSLKRILFLPLFFTASFIRHRNLVGDVFWDILGFATYIIAKKEEKEN